MNIFEYAARSKIRFQSTKGELTVEQLWDVPLRSRDDFNLNAVAKAAGVNGQDAWRCRSSAPSRSERSEPH